MMRTEKYFLKTLITSNNKISENLEGTEDGTRKLIKDIVNDEEFKSVIKSNNTDSNKRDKLQEIIGNKNIKTLDINHKLYDYFEKDEIREKMIHMFISRPELLNQLRG
jgi:hypothetical protein